MSVGTREMYRVFPIGCITDIRSLTAVHDQSAGRGPITVIQIRGDAEIRLEIASTPEQIEPLFC